jgi:hypothetical protein
MARYDPADMVEVAVAFQTARGKLREATEAARAMAIKANSAGIPETEIANDLGVNRLTVRRWIGKG